MTYEQRLQHLRNLWLNASKEDRPIIELRAKVLRLAQGLEKSGRPKVYDAYSEAKKIFDKKT